MSTEIYKERLLRHYKKPKNNSRPADYNFSSEELNTSCGDKISMFGKIDRDILVDVGFEGYGCVISQAAASMLTEKCKGKKINEVLELKSEDVFEVLGTKLGPNRARCALMSLFVLQEGIKKYLKGKTNDKS